MSPYRNPEILLRLTFCSFELTCVEACFGGVVSLTLVPSISAYTYSVAMLLFPLGVYTAIIMQTSNVAATIPIPFLSFAELIMLEILKFTHPDYQVVSKY